MMTDDKLNRAMADVCPNAKWDRCPCGRKDCDDHKPPHFCSDRNTLPEILDALDQEPHRFHKRYVFCKHLSHAFESQTNMDDLQDILRLPMRDIVIAALKALGKMPADGGGA